MKFYDGRLKNGPTAQHPLSLSNFVKTNKSLFFFNLCFGKEEKSGKSFVNNSEIALVSKTAIEFLKIDSTITIGIITPYKSQAISIESKLMKSIKDENKSSRIKVSTVDAFQGQERNIIIFSSVRANKKGQVGFVNDERRLNVSLTRAQNLLIAFGNE